MRERRVEFKDGSDWKLSSRMRYSYDQLNRMTQVERLDKNNPDMTGDDEYSIRNIAYDPLSRRVREDHKADPEESWRHVEYVYEAASDTVVGELSSQAETPSNRWFMHDPDGNQLSEVRSASTRHIITDYLNSARVVTNGAAEVVASFDYETYGQPKDSPLTSGTHDERVRMSTGYTGQHYDPTGEVTHHAWREYAPNLASWAQTDQYLNPLADLGLSTNAHTADRHAYTYANPTTYYDPTGHSRKRAAGFFGWVGDVATSIGGALESAASYFEERVPVLSAVFTWGAGIAHKVANWSYTHQYHLSSPGPARRQARTNAILAQRRQERLANQATRRRKDDQEQRRRDGAQYISIVAKYMGPAGDSMAWIAGTEQQRAALLLDNRDPRLRPPEGRSVGRTSRGVTVLRAAGPVSTAYDVVDSYGRVYAATGNHAPAMGAGASLVALSYASGRNARIGAAGGAIGCAATGVGVVVAKGCGVFLGTLAGAGTMALGAPEIVRTWSGEGW